MVCVCVSVSFGVNGSHIFFKKVLYSRNHPRRPNPCHQKYFSVKYSFILLFSNFVFVFCFINRIAFVWMTSGMCWISVLFRSPCSDDWLFVKFQRFCFGFCCFFCLLDAWKQSARIVRSSACCEVFLCLFGKLHLNYIIHVSLFSPLCLLSSDLVVVVVSN